MSFTSKFTCAFYICGFFLLVTLNYASSALSSVHFTLLIQVSQIQRSNITFTCNYYLTYQIFGVEVNSPPPLPSCRPIGMGGRAAFPQFLPLRRGGRARKNGPAEIYWCSTSYTSLHGAIVLPISHSTRGRCLSKFFYPRLLIQNDLKVLDRFALSTKRFVIFFYSPLSRVNIHITSVRLFHIWVTTQDNGPKSIGPYSFLMHKSKDEHILHLVQLKLFFYLTQFFHKYDR